MAPESMSSPFFETRAHGKLLLTGEYFVLDGATALALPVGYGQTLRVEKKEMPGSLTWASKNDDGTVWFQAEYELPGLLPLASTDEKTSDILASILKACRRQNSGFLTDNRGYNVTTQNDFPREWGLGTSSTLIAALARWANVDPYAVLFDTFGGSGYDIACAYAEGPILYRLDGQMPTVQPVQFDPPFAQSLYFVYLGKKQDSRDGILRYRERVRGNTALIAEISRLTEYFLAASSLSDLDAVIHEHENLIARALDLPRAKELYFKDFWGEIKSLGAWGGDFVLATSERSVLETEHYFSGKELGTVLNWKAMTSPKRF